ncbi:MAG TPA: nuclease-related domain-containing protein [Cerasibacillus sp.]|uniref:nuclease-related domain-containing protein n=1 Tax=Cerasibacillus sp. TaxID=2498711 RepID=UPI002F41DED7
MKNVKKELEKPKSLQKLQILFARSNLSRQEKQRYNKKMKGYIGEKEFYNLLKKNLPTNAIILHDLLLESNNSIFQIDNILVHGKTIFSFEVKNFEGEFYIDNGNWYVKATQQEIRNPLHQLKKNDYLLRHLVQQLGYNIPIKSYLVFVNPEFTLYQLPVNLPIILPTQLNRFSQNLNRSFTPPNQGHHQLAKELKNLQITDSPFENITNYNFKQLKKGITCPKCFSLLSRHTLRTLMCGNCDFSEEMKHAILRSVVEFKILFPNKKITTNIIYEWCGKIVSKQTIRKILSENLIIIKTGRYSYYEFRNKADAVNNSNE